MKIEAITAPIMDAPRKERGDAPCPVAWFHSLSSPGLALFHQCLKATSTVLVFEGSQSCHPAASKVDNAEMLQLLNHPSARVSSMGHGISRLTFSPSIEGVESLVLFHGVTHGERLEVVMLNPTVSTTDEMTFAWQSFWRMVQHIIDLRPASGEEKSAMAKRVDQSLEARVGEKPGNVHVLAESEERFRGAFQSAGVAMAVVDLDGHFLEVNTSLCEFLCYSENELYYFPISAITHADDVEKIICYLKDFPT
ncbi:MAG: hypothetical protein JWN25_3471, partial [Verrucomicrobiales bacterium]|nr:hypothetical protein [Verrucomicrobiales bacterium]